MNINQLHTKTALILSPNDYKQYNPFFHLSRKKVGILDRYERAFLTAKEVATFLRSQYDAYKIYVFGSLSDMDTFNQWSDIDLAVEGIQSNIFYKAVADIIDANHEFEIDLINLNDCKQEIRKSVELYGIEI